ncbi:hypothetical protein OnM2_059074 [Erysiphe neolycopersici]|uniref:Uncharacterized protein n=1 Tax=Erysiphe neolycopersici TaxID=212602 RepID=A0A420HQ30_9PEZI|nr:hypothetical protein OnM2_059074 [Erysiphe neolycopersici]
MVTYEVYSEEEMNEFIRRHKNIIVCVYYTTMSDSSNAIFETLSEKYPQFMFIEIHASGLRNMSPHGTEPECSVYVAGSFITDNLRLDYLENRIRYLLSCKLDGSNFVDC